MGDSRSGPRRPRPESLMMSWQIGITPALVLLSVGIEHPEDLIADLEQALGRIGEDRPAARPPLAAKEG